MVTVIPGDKTWENVGSNIGQGLVQGYTNRADEMAIQKALSDLPPNASMKDVLTTLTNVKTYSPKPKQEMLKNYMGVAKFEEMKKKREEITRHNKAVEEAAIEKSTANATKEKEKIDSMVVGLGTIDRMLSIRKKGNLGRGSGLLSNLGGETARDFGEYEQLGKSLIALSSNIPIRNQREFEALAHGLYDPTIPDTQAEGMLRALQGFLSRSIQQQSKKAEKKLNAERPPLSSFQEKK